MLGCWSRAASRASREEPLAQVVAVDPQDLEGDLALGHWVERQIEHAHATVRNALTELVTADCRGWRGQCADYTHRPPRRPCRGRRRRDRRSHRRVPTRFRPPRGRRVRARRMLAQDGGRPTAPIAGGPPGVPSRWPASATPARQPPKGIPPLQPRLAPRQTAPAATKRPGMPWPPAAAPPARARSCGGSRAAPRSTCFWHHPRARRPRPGAAAVGREGVRRGLGGLHRDPHG